jgi:hypothetical protein
MKTIRELLANRGRRWVGRPPATDAEIDALRKAVWFDLPPVYVELLRACNGGEGDLAIEPRWFQLFDTRFATEMATLAFYRREFKDFFFFGSNGGGELIGFNMLGQAPWPTVMVDCIAGADSAKEIAPNIDRFVEAVGIPVADGNE